MYVILSHSLVRQVLTQNSPLKKISKLNTWTITLLVKKMNIPSERINFPSVQYDENRLNITPYCYVKKNENEKKTFVLFIREKKSSATK